MCGRRRAAGWHRVRHRVGRPHRHARRRKHQRVPRRRRQPGTSPPSTTPTPTAATTTGPAARKEPSDAPVEEEKSDDSGASDSREGRTANKMPSKLPEAPPVDIIPLPEELPPLPLEPPGEARCDRRDHGRTRCVAIRGKRIPRDETAGDHRATRAAGAHPWHVDHGARHVATARSRRHRAGLAEPLPPPRQPTTELREPPITSAGLSGPGQTANRTGYTKDGLPRVRLPGLAASALPGIGGIIVMTAAGVCLGHRQATAANRLRAHGVDRFLA